MTLLDILAACGAALTGLAGAAAFLHPRVRARRAARKAARDAQAAFYADWHGTPERPGVPARAGVMVRLSDLEKASAATVESVGQLSEQVARVAGAVAQVEALRADVDILKRANGGSRYGAS